MSYLYQIYSSWVYETNQRSGMATSYNVQGKLPIFQFIMFIYLSNQLIHLCLTVLVTHYLPDKNNKDGSTPYRPIKYRQSYRFAIVHSGKSFLNLLAISDVLLCLLQVNPTMLPTHFCPFLVRCLQLHI